MFHVFLLLSFTLYKVFWPLFQVDLWQEAKRGGGGGWHLCFIVVSGSLRSSDGLRQRGLSGFCQFSVTLKEHVL